MSASRSRAVAQACKDIAHNFRTLVVMDRRSPPYLLPPHDADAEYAVLESLLNGRRKPSELPCAAADFYRVFHCLVFGAVEQLEELGLLKDEPDIGIILDGLEARGINRSDAWEDLLAIKHQATMRVYVHEYAERVLALATRRRAISAMLRYDAAWRVGEELSIAELIRELRELEALE